MKKEVKALDPTDFIRACFEKHGKLGLHIAVDMVRAFDAKMFASPWSAMIKREIFEDVVELAALSHEEGLDAQYGNFFDQRYIDFLHRNFDDIDRIHWRKFEGLTAEFFTREGFSVEVGPGRNDEGVDVRVWPSTADEGKPPSLIIQCKRQKGAVDKVVIKALYADVAYERAEAGLLVTTARLAPGARKVCEARAYPVSEVDRETLRTWIGKMHVPGAGVGY
jgi:restriction system protein